MVVTRKRLFLMVLLSVLLVACGSSGSQGNEAQWDEAAWDQATWN
jgi:outer membrane biogenesis lipoprotein LolB